MYARPPLEHSNRIWRPARSIPPPERAGPSHMDFLESLPGLGTVWHVVAAAAPQNRIRNRPESKREQLLRTFDAFRSQHLTAPRFFPYAIPLPCGGGLGRGVTAGVSACVLP